MINTIFFENSAALRKWFELNYDEATEISVGYYKKNSGKPSITWPESVDQALCFGWIDGVRNSIDDTSYRIRFTPRKAGSIWSAVNIKRAGELIEMGLMRPAGLAAFEKRVEGRSKIYAYEQGECKLSDEFEADFKLNKEAWQFFSSQAASYQKTAVWWVISAKQDATRRRRLAALILDSAGGRKIAQLRREKQ
jgi:uncharacterized protein YdeI (YjbR/CyaY-like superfamily)